MEGSSNVTCPVCTLYLRPGMTMEDHLATHPKQKVIEALLRVTQSTDKSNECNNIQPHVPQPQQQGVPQIAQQGIPPIPQQQGMPQILQQGIPQIAQQQGIPQIPQQQGIPQITQQQGMSMQMNQMPQNQSFIYQQFTSTTGNQFIGAPISPLNNLNQQQFIAIPAFIPPQMVSPCFYQQQQQLQIVTASSNFPPFLQRSQEISPITPGTCQPTVTEIQEPVTPPRSSVIAVSEKRTPTTSELISEKLIALEMNSKDKDDEPIVVQDEEKKEEVEESTTNETKNEIKDEDELSKACQTTQEKQSVSDDITTAADSNEGVTILPDPESEFDENQTEIAPINNFENIHENIESNKNRSNKPMMLDVSTLNFILPNEIPEQDVEMEKENDKQDEPILMNIDDESLKDISMSVISHKLDVPDFDEEDDRLDDELSHQGLNIRADEKMPARGELSEQESNGASEIGWGSRIYQEGSSGISASYDLIARESWEASDCSDSEMPPLQSRIQPPMDYNAEDVDEPDPIYTDERDEKTSFTFDCSTCEQSFRCPKERRVHQAEHQADDDVDDENSTSSSSSSISEDSPRTSIKFKDEKLSTNEEDKNEIKVELADEKPVIEDADIEEKELLLCNICGELLPSMKDLTVHNKKQHNIGQNTNFICKTCKEPFHRQRDYIKHLKIHPLECVICSKLFFKPANLKVHLKRHSGDKPHKCEICHKSFFAKQKLREHLNIHNNVSPIKCTQCDESFKRYSNLIQHRNHHHLNIRKKTRDYICYCGEICHSKSKFNWHKETHETKPKSCMYCNEKFIHIASLTRHIRRAHNNHYVPDENRKCENVECDICKGVYLKSSLDAHLHIHTGKKPYTCTICNKEFTTKWNLKLHKWIHAAPTSKPFKCDVCQNAYFRESDYNAHMNSHRSVKPYTCNYCGCKFIRKYNCIRHVKEHEENKNFTCEVCNKSFHRSYYLKEHMRVHTGVRPYSCNICGKTSTTKSNHNKHMKIHHAREPVTTEG